MEKPTNKIEMLDYILAMSIELKSPSTGDLNEFLDIELSYLGYLCEHLKDKGLVELTAISTLSSGRADEYLVRASNKGRSFYLMEGGFKKQRRIEIVDDVWKFVKIGAGFINGVAVIYLSYLSYDYQKQKDIKDETVKKTQVVVTNFESKIRRLDSIIEVSNNRILILKDSLKRQSKSNELALVKKGK